MRKTLVSRLIILFAATVLLAGCAAPAKKTTRVLWPALPDEPRLEWIGTYHSQNDFPKTAAERRLEAITGPPPPILFEKPTGIASDGKGIVYVSDSQVSNIRVYDFNQRTVSFLTKTPVANRPLGLAVDSAGRLYVADADTRKVMVFSPERQPLFSFGGPEYLEKPAYLALNERLGRIYVSDAKGNRVAVFDQQGEHLFSFGQRGGGEGEFFSPQGLAVDGQDRVFVCDTFNARIQAFDADGNFLSAFGERGDRGWQFESPKDIAVSSEGHLYVVDARKGAMAIYQDDGRLLLYYAGGKGRHPLSMDFPNAIYIDQDDRIYVTDMLQLRFQVWQYLTEDYLREHPIER